MPNPQMFVKMVANGQQADINVVGGDDLVSWALGDDSDVVFFLRTTTLAADTALSVDSDDVLVGTPVTEALAADSLIISNVTASGDILIAANRGGNSEEYVKVDSSAGALYLSGYQGGTMLALAANPPAPDQSVVHIWGGSAGSVAAGSDAILVAENSAPATIQLLTPNNSYSAIYFSDPDASAGQILYDHSNVRFNIAIEASNRLLWTTSEMAFQQAQTISTSSGNLTITAGGSTGDVLIGDGDGTILYVDGGTNNVGIGAVSANAALNIGGTFTGSSFTSAVRVVTALTDPPGNGTNSIGVHIATNFTEVADASTTTRASLRVVRPTTTAASGAAVTNSASVYISDAPTGGATPTNGHYSIFVDAGNSRFDGNIKMGTNSEFSTTEGTNGIIFGAGTAPNGTASTAGQLYSDNSGDDLSFEHADGTEDELTT